MTPPRNKPLKNCGPPAGSGSKTPRPSRDSRKKTIQAIRQALEKDTASVPQIAEAVGLPTATVLWFVAGMKKYGQVVEAGQDDSYFRYALVAGKPQEADPAEAEG